MTPLRQRMLDDMHLRGLSPNTQRCYVQAVRLFAQHFDTSPDQLTVIFHAKWHVLGLLSKVREKGLT